MSSNATVDRNTSVDPLPMVDGPVRKTVADLGIQASKVLANDPSKGTWEASQEVEPTRDGQPWCDWPDAEDLLVRAALAANRGIDMSMKAYALLPDWAVMVLRLVIA